jgi:phosphoglycerol transferase MdoB-like AlkP superfamily enzyme
MIFWIAILFILTVLSYLTDVGVVTFLQNLKVPVLNASLLSLVILLCAAGLLIRMLWMKRKGEKERLRQKIQELEAKLKQP